MFVFLVVMHLAQTGATVEVIGSLPPRTMVSDNYTIAPMDARRCSSFVPTGKTEGIAISCEEPDDVVQILENGGMTCVFQSTENTTAPVGWVKQTYACH